MTEQQMPARIWADGPFAKVASIRTEGEIPYYRADIAERMAEALEKTALVCAGDTTTKRGLIEALESARSALTAFKSATQDTEANR